MIEAGLRTKTPPGALAAVVGAVVLWSGSAFFVRAGHADPLVYTTYRVWFAVPLLGAALVWRARRTGGRSVNHPTGAGGVVGVLAVYAGAGLLFATGAVTAFAAIGHTTLLNVGLIGALQPVVVIAAAVAFLGERADRSHLVRALVAVAGTALVVSAASTTGTWSLKGDVFAVVSLVVNSGWYLYGRFVRSRFAVDPLAFMFGVLAGAAVLLTPFAWVAHGSLALPPAAAGYAAATMVVGTSAHLLSVWAHRWVPASVSSPLLLAETVLIAFGAWALFGESLTAPQILGSAVVLGTLVGMVRSPALEHVDESTADPAAPA